MAAHQLNSKLQQRNSASSLQQPSKLSILGIVFFLMGAPNIYAFLQRRTDASAMATFSGGGVPRYAVVVLVAMVIAGIVEFTLVA